MVYEKNTWEFHDTIATAKLNHMEDGLDTLNCFDINFEFTGIPGYATVDKTLAEVQAAHEAGRRVWLSGEMDGAVLHVEVTGFVYSGEDLTAWVAVTTEIGNPAPSGVYLIQSSGVDAATFNVIPVS